MIIELLQNQTAPWVVPGISALSVFAFILWAVQRWTPNMRIEGKLSAMDARARETTKMAERGVANSEANRAALMEAVESLKVVTATLSNTEKLVEKTYEMHNVKSEGVPVWYNASLKPVLETLAEIMREQVAVSREVSECMRSTKSIMETFAEEAKECRVRMEKVKGVSG